MENLQLFVLYASETGNGESISEDFLSSFKKSHSKQSKVVAMAKRAEFN